MTPSTPHELGRIDQVTLADEPALSRDVHLDTGAIQAGWPSFETSFDSLKGRKMMGLIYAADEVYRMATVRLDRDNDNSLGYAETVIPGGAYLRLRLRSTAPGVYDQIAAAFETLFSRGDHDPSRPHIEYYRREGEVDCLVPVAAPS